MLQVLFIQAEVNVILVFHSVRNAPTTEVSGFQVKPLFF